MPVLKLSPSTLRQHKGVSFTGITTIFFCYDANGRLFLSKRSEQARDEQGRWEPGAGGLKFGQTLEQNVRRELNEEYGVEPLRLDFIGYWDIFRTLPDNTPTHWLAMSFAAEVDPVKLVIADHEPIEDSGWFSLDALPQPLHSQFDVFMRLYGDDLKKLMRVA